MESNPPNPPQPPEPFDETPSASPESRRAPRRVQFSLRTLLLTVVIAALLAGLVAMRLQMAALRTELSQVWAELEMYRRELGHLEIDDRRKVHAVGLRDTGELSWQWRVYLPKGRRYALCMATRGIPAEGVSPNASRSIGPGPGEALFSARVERGIDGGLWVRVSAPGGGSGSSLGDSPPAWLSEASTEAIGTDATVSVEPGEPLVLLRRRETVEEKGPGGTTWRKTPDEPCDGLMIWIEEVP